MTASLTFPEAREFVRVALDAVYKELFPQYTLSTSPQGADLGDRWVVFLEFVEGQANAGARLMGAPVLLVKKDGSGIEAVQSSRRPEILDAPRVNDTHDDPIS